MKETGSRLSASSSEAQAGPGHTGAGLFYQEALLALWLFAEQPRTVTCSLATFLPNPPRPSLLVKMGGLFPRKRSRNIPQRPRVGLGGSTCLSLFCSGLGLWSVTLTLGRGRSEGVGRPLLLEKVFVSSAGKSPSSDENKLQSPQREPRARSVRG